MTYVAECIELYIVSKFI